MQHLRKGRSFKRVRSQRKALMKSLLGNLILHEKIKTTEAKAKEMKGMIDKLINKGKKAQEEGKKVAVVRSLKSELANGAAMKLVSNDFIGKFSSRNSGYTRILRLDRRKGDSAEVAIIEFV